MDNKHPSWSPDGTSVIFEFHREGRMPLHLVRADGTAERDLTRGLSRAQHPSWQLLGLGPVFAPCHRANFRVFDPLAFLAGVSAHIPDPHEKTTTYYGLA